MEPKKEAAISGNICPTCHAPLMMLEGCEKCSSPDCGYSKCS